MTTVFRMYLMMSLLAWASTVMAQEPRRLEDVEVGMSREQVLAGLSGRYRLTDALSLDMPGQAYIVSEVEGAERVVGELYFTEERVVAVAISQAQPSYGEAVTLARNLYRVGRSHARLVRDDLGMQTRTGTATIMLREVRVPNLEQEEIWIAIEGRRNRFRIRISKVGQSEEYVTIDLVKGEE